MSRALLLSVMMVCVATGAAFGETAAEKTAQKMFKAAAKTRLAQAKADLKDALDAFYESLNESLDAVKGGDDPEDHYIDVVNYFATAYQDAFDAVVAANEGLDDDGSFLLDDLDGVQDEAGPENVYGFIEGDGGTLDKYNESLKKLVDAYVAKLAKSLKKIAKVAKGSSSGESLFAGRLNPLRMPAPPTPSALGNNAGDGINSYTPMQVCFLFSFRNTMDADGGLALGGLAEGDVQYRQYNGDLGTLLLFGNASLLGDTFVIFLATQAPGNYEFDIADQDGGYTGAPITDSIGVR